MTVKWERERPLRLEYRNKNDRKVGDAMRHRILIADDEPIERAVINRKIKKYFPEQLDTVMAVNGREAINLFFEEKCEMAILDIEMPGINGLAAAEEIRKRDKHCSIIFQTAFDEFLYAKKAISVRALDYLLKPGADEELIAVLEEAIRIAEQYHQKTEEVTEANAEAHIESEELCEIGFDNKENRNSAAQKRILRYIEEHYMEDISMQDAAEEMNYADAYFCKLFKQCFDQNFTSYLSAYRIKKAQKLLEDITINVKEISEMVGYRDSNYFAKVFKRIAGVTPSEYRFMKIGK